MKIFNAALRTLAPLCLRIILLILIFFGINLVNAEELQPEKNAKIPIEESLRQGEKIYREGILPSGKPMLAFIKGDITVSGTAFTCGSCHLRSGIGSFEGGVVTPATNGSKIFQPLQPIYKGVEQKYFSPPPARPAYTDSSLADVIRAGINPLGEGLNDIMPRYVLEDEDMAILISYLKSLSSEFSPGYDSKILRFATIITDDVDPEERKALIDPLEKYINIKNSQVSLFESSPRHARMAKSMRAMKDLSFLRLSLSHWVLKGPPDTWQSQLEDYNRKEPVFAIISGITKGEWKPIHDFSETNRIPCLFPITDFPVISETDWYTLYFSKGYYQEGEAAARYLNGMTELLKDRPIMQIVRASLEGQALSNGFQKTWGDLGHQSPKTITLKTGEKLSEAGIEKILANEKPSVILLWVGPEDLPLLDAIADNKNKPGMVFVSSVYLGKSLWTLNEPLRGFTYITFPFTFSQDKVKSMMDTAEDEQVPLKQENIRVQDNARKISNLTLPLTQMLSMALMNMRGDYYRDNFLDVISMSMDQESLVYGNLSFGPGQRYASKGCYIVQLSQGAKPELLKKSDWVIY